MSVVVAKNSVVFSSAATLCLHVLYSSGIATWLKYVRDGMLIHCRKPSLVYRVEGHHIFPYELRYRLSNFAFLNAGTGL